MRRITRNVVLGLGLFTALAAGGLLVRRPDPASASPAPIPARPPTLSIAPPTRVATPDPRRASLGPVVRSAAPLAPSAGPLSPSPAASAGYEIPFADAADQPTGLTASASTADWRAPLVAALATNDDRAISALLNGGNPAIEIEALRLLVQLGDTRVQVMALHKLLTVSPDDPAYPRYLTAFSSCRNPAIIEWLTEYLGESETQEMRSRILNLLCALRGPEVVERLAAHWATPADALHADDCADLLATTDDPMQGRALTDLLDGTVAPALMTNAAYGLASLGNADACIALLERGAAAAANAPACRAALATVTSSYGQETLIQAALDPSIPSSLRCAAVEALARQPGPRVYTVLANLARATRDPALQAATAQALHPPHPDPAPRSHDILTAEAGITGDIGF